MLEVLRDWFRLEEVGAALEATQGQMGGFLVNSNANANSSRQYLWEIDLRFALNYTSGWGWTDRRVDPQPAVGETHHRHADRHGHVGEACVRLKNNCLAEMWIGSEECLYLRLKYCCFSQLWAWKRKKKKRARQGTISEHGSLCRSKRIMTWNAGVCVCGRWTTVRRVECQPSPYPEEKVQSHM